MLKEYSEMAELTNRAVRAVDFSIDFFRDERHLEAKEYAKMAWYCYHVLRVEWRSVNYALESLYWVRDKGVEDENLDTLATAYELILDMLERCAEQCKAEIPKRCKDPYTKDLFQYDRAVGCNLADIERAMHGVLDFIKGKYESFMPRFHFGFSTEDEYCNATEILDERLDKISAVHFFEGGE